MIDNKNKLIFIHIPRTGGTSIEECLIGNDWWNIDSKSKHICASDARKLYGEKIWNSYTKFSIIRNPWDRIVSMRNTGWWDNVSNVPNRKPLLDLLKSHGIRRTFLLLVRNKGWWHRIINTSREKHLYDFIKNLGIHPNEHYTSQLYSDILDEEMDYIIRFEHLQKDFDNMLSELNIQEKKLSHVNKTKRGHYRDWYDEKSKALVEEIYKEDIEKYNYSF